MASAPGDSEPLQWGAASIDWSPAGQVLTVPTYLDSRATLLLSEALPEAIPSASFDYSLREAAWTRDQGGVSVEPGELTIVGLDLFDTAPEQLKMLINNAANRAKRRAADDQARDDERSRAYVEGLRTS
jgi:hypothetical protein